MAGVPLQLLPPPPPLATMVSLTVREPVVVSLCRLAPNDEWLPENVAHAMAVVPKFWTAPPPFVPAVLPLNVLLVTLTAELLSIAPPPAVPVALFPLNVSRATFSGNNAT